MGTKKRLFYFLYMLLWAFQGIMLYLKINAVIATNIFFLGLSFIIFISIILDIYLLKNEANWFDFFLLELSVYNIIDEKLGRGATFDWYELYIAIGLFFINLTFNYRKTIWKYLFQKV